MDQHPGGHHLRRARNPNHNPRNPRHHLPNIKHALNAFPLTIHTTKLTIIRIFITIDGTHFIILICTYLDAEAQHKSHRKQIRTMS
jgi:hypothetical protein